MAGNASVVTIEAGKIHANFFNIIFPLELGLTHTKHLHHLIP